MRLLELFKGTGSVGRVFEGRRVSCAIRRRSERGVAVTSVDIDARWNPDIRVDILDWDYRRDVRPGEFDYV